MSLFNRELKELFDFSSKERPKVVADEIQANVEEAGKGRGLGAATKKPNFPLSKAGQNLYGASQGALDKQAELKAQREADQQQSINSILLSVMKETDKETEKYGF